ncbi:nuclear transport factor 2 family protein [Actinomycetospora lutea]|uniref:YybH family protein n=1 Tax=Actinomycetospora lutea TaxID=663604 RepID=UPI002366B571|nr:nuclear transport factor 2 family protein [Actinomycetospora lutea]MDD7942732.1 nuclear transport factor 2 family protein [Actinomycetospora lutea]
MTTLPAATEAPADFLAFLDRVEAALAAMFTGDPQPYADLWPERDDVTLYGAWGPIEQGRADVTRTFTWVGSRFSDGVTEPVEYRVVAVSGDLAHTVGFERGVVRVDGGEPAPMVLRVTHGFRRIDGDWWLTHRHADFPPADPRTR